MSNTKAKALEKSFDWKEAALLIPNPKKGKETDDLRTRMALASAFNIPPQGINILQGKPYINTDGLEYKLHQHPKAFTFRTTIRHRFYEKVGDIAIVEVMGEDENGGFRSAVGTASAQNMSMVKAYPNEIAETRAQNRVLRRVLVPYFMDDFMSTWSDMGGDDRKEILQIIMKSDFGRVSAEELGAPQEGEVSPTVLLTEEQMKVIVPFVERIVAVKEPKQLEEVVLDITAQKEKFNDLQLKQLRDTLSSVKTEKGWI